MKFAYSLFILLFTWFVLIKYIYKRVRRKLDKNFTEEMCERMNKVVFRFAVLFIIVFSISVVMSVLDVNKDFIGGVITLPNDLNKYFEFIDVLWSGRNLIKLPMEILNSFVYYAVSTLSIYIFYINKLLNKGIKIPMFLRFILYIMFSLNFIYILSGLIELGGSVLWIIRWVI